MDGKARWLISSVTSSYRRIVGGPTYPTEPPSGETSELVNVCSSFQPVRRLIDMPAVLLPTWEQLRMPSVQLPKKEVLIVDDESARGTAFRSSAAPRASRLPRPMTAGRPLRQLLEIPAQFGLVITDLHLPGADGFEVLGPPVAPTVGLRRHDHRLRQLDSAVRAVREGAYDYLAKPFALGQLEVVLTRIRDRMALEQREPRVVDAPLADATPRRCHLISHGDCRRSKSAWRTSKRSFARDVADQGQSHEATVAVGRHRLPCAT